MYSKKKVVDICILLKWDEVAMGGDVCKVNNKNRSESIRVCIFNNYI
jgi:hypothetical protein